MKVSAEGLFSCFKVVLILNLNFQTSNTGGKVLKKIHDRTKLGLRWEGPYPIERVHVNGNVTVALKPGVLERINIRRVKPYHEPTLPPNVTEAAI